VFIYYKPTDFNDKQGIVNVIHNNISKSIEIENIRLEKEDVIFHLDEHIITTFIGLVAADELILSPSSFSYVAGLLSDGIVYYKKFWHGKKNAWNLCG
jgi:hypothetical protein